MLAIDISEWPADEEHPFFPEGSRDKRLLRCPEPAPDDSLIANHRYLFKKSRTVYPEQFWAEIVAYRIGRLTGVPVPPAFPALNARTGECAALIEFFYGHPGRLPAEGFLSGGLFMKAIIRDYDLKRGRQHNFSAVEAWCSLLARGARTEQGQATLEADWLLRWAQMLTFDALIGNTDRHHENWGFLVCRGAVPTDIHFRLAPAFDNGTSLGHERPVDQFARFGDPKYLSGYIRKGRHHMRWHLADPHPARHAELLLKILEKHPQCRPAMLAVLQFDPQELEQDLLALTQIELPVRLSVERARFMLRLVHARRDYLEEALTSP